jgi:hypothetical protein
MGVSVNMEHLAMFLVGDLAFGLLAAQSTSHGAVSMKFIVGAYASAPAEDGARYLDMVAELPGFGGVELQYAGPADSAGAVTALQPSWDVVATTIGITVGRNAADPEFGLASSSPEGRRAAVDLVRGLAGVVKDIDDRAGRSAVVGVELHSAPTGRGSREALAASLDEIAGWDWDDALLTVEHCDSVAGAPPLQKGYLTLQDEMDVIARLAGRVAMTINWGRSAIDGRDRHTPVYHLDLVRAAGLLGGLMFSGVAAEPTAYGAAWIDAHLPPAAGGDPRFADLASTEPASLLGPQEVADALAAAGDVQRFTGLKIGVRPLDLPAESRLAYVRDALDLLDRLGAAELPSRTQ